MAEPIAGDVLTQQDDERRQGYRHVMQAGRAIAVEPYPALAFAELAEGRDHAAGLALPAVDLAIRPPDSLVRLDCLTNGL